MKKFILLLRKGVYPYGYRGDWEKFSEASLQKTRDLSSELNMENITDGKYKEFSYLR